MSATHAEAEPSTLTEAPRVVHVEAVGVGPAAAAAGTARLIALAEARGEPYTAVISAGIAGGFVGQAEVGATVLGTRSIAADLGAEAPNQAEAPNDAEAANQAEAARPPEAARPAGQAEAARPARPTGQAESTEPSAASGRGFIPIEELGFGSSVVAADAALLKMLSSALPYAVVGDVLTLATVTGTAATAAALQARFPDAVAEAMEGYGVAIAAQAAGLPFVELRTISNPIGPRDRAAWRVREAFSALTEAARKACG
ncbi:futalosine hydrolase [Winogradskya humida]|uniref:futalosine hydrolase n=1 Tax=Winogradskya humida TaxID=113566 RepID=UPI0023B26997|nr:futalosine hydrolase [Actinoplanes humidus]